MSAEAKKRSDRVDLLSIHKEPIISLSEARVLLKAKERGLSDTEVAERVRVIDDLGSLMVEMYMVHKSSQVS